MEGGGARCEDTSVTHPVKSDDPDNKDTLDDPLTSSESGYAGSVVCSEDSRPKGNLSGPKPHNEDSMPRDISFPGPQPHKKRMEGTATNSHEEPDRMSLCSEKSIPTGPCFGQDNVNESLIHQSEVCKRCERSCGVCLGNVHHAVKHCKTCRVSYCETHVADHYKPPAFSSHELADYKQTSRVSLAKEHSLQRSSSDPVVLPEMRVMILGKTGAGKSASGNTILGREAFKSEAPALPVTKSCNRQSGVVEGRNITVIDTPAITTRKAAWLSEKVDPGPHVFLLMIPLGRCTEEDGKGVKWIQRNFGEEALKFTIILFTGGDWLKGKPLEHFLHESSKLQTLLGRVEGRYHVFNNSLPTDRNQVKGLIKKIENVLICKLGYVYTHEERQKVKTDVRQEYEREKEKAGRTRNQYLEKEREAVRQEYEREKENAERTRDQELEKVKMAVRQEYEREKENAERTRNQDLEKERKAVRQECEREKAEITRNQKEKNMRDNQAYKAGIALMLLIILSILTALALRFHHYPEDPVELPELRMMMLGQTGSGKSASGNTILGREAFKSKASALPVTKYFDSQSGVVEGRNITVIDTPAITTRKAACLAEKVDPGPHVFLLVIPLGNTEEDGKEVKWIQSNFGEEALKFTIILFIGGDEMDQKKSEQFLYESSGLQTLVNSTGGGYHIFDNKTPRGRGQVKGLLEKIELLLRKNMGYSYSYGLHNQVKTDEREEEERKRRKEEGERKRRKEEEEEEYEEEEEGEEERKRHNMERDIQINQVMKNMEKRFEWEIRGQMELKMMNEFREVIKATTEQGEDSLQRQVRTTVREEEERKRRESEEEDKRKKLKMERDMKINLIKTREKRMERKIMEQMELKMLNRIANATATFNELREVFKARIVNFVILLAGVVMGFIGLTGLLFLRLRGVIKATCFCLSYLSGVVIGFIGLWILGKCI